MKYYFFFDLDGSLLDRRGNLSKRTIEYVNYLTGKGHEVIITTGRPFVGAINFYHELNLKGPLITDNGAYISNPSNPNFKEIKLNMTLEDSHKLFRLVKHITISALYNVDEKVYIYNYDERLSWLFHVTKEEDIIICDFDKVNAAPTGIIFTLLDEHQTYFETIITKHFKKITYRLWGTKDGISLYEVYVIENTKGNAINMIIDMFKVNRDFTIAFGDDLNDFDMLQTVGHGVSMLNARNGLESATKYQTYLTNQDDGIVDYLEKVFNF